MVTLNTQLNIFQRNNESYSAYSISRQQHTQSEGDVEQSRYMESERIVENNGELEKSTYVEISYESSRGQRSISASSVEKYQAIGNTKAPANSPSANILKFIETQLARDLSAGATNEELRERLQSGAEGFEKGFGEGLEQVESLGWDTPKVRAGLTETFDKVTQGLALLAEKYGLDSPEAGDELAPAELDNQSGEQVKNKDGLLSSDAQSPANKQIGLPEQQKQMSAPGQSSLINGSSSLNSLSSRLDLVSKSSSDAKLVEAALAEQASSNLKPGAASASKASDTAVASEAGYHSYDFQLKTLDGDVVTVSAYSEFGQAAAISGGEIGKTGFSEDYFNFSVEGELDEAELAAINDLLLQVNDVAELFFSGDVYGAYEQALEIGFNDSELLQFSLNLEQTQVTQVEETYREVQGMNAPEKIAEQSSIDVIGEFVNKLNILDQGLQHMGLNFQVAQDLFAMLDRSLSNGPENNRLGELAERLGSQKADFAP